MIIKKTALLLTIIDVVKDWLDIRGLDPVYGARSLKRVNKTQIVNLLMQREDDSKNMEFEATVSDDGEKIEFAEVFNDVSEWAD